MATEKVMELLNAIRTDPRAQELLKDRPQPKNEEEMIRLYAELASRLGFEVTEAEIQSAFREAQRARKERTDAASAEIQKLSDEDVATAAGGGDYDFCGEFMYCDNWFAICESHGAVCASSWGTHCFPGGFDVN